MLKISLTGFFSNFGSKWDWLLQIKCENFIMDCPEGFWAILDQTLAFTTLDKNWIADALYLSVRSCDTTYLVRESKSKLELFSRLFIELFVFFFWP